MHSKEVLDDMVELQADVTPPKANSPAAQAKQTCRICLQRSYVVYDLFSKPIDEGDTTENLTLAQILQPVLDIKYERSTILPNNVCIECVRRVESFNEFREKSKDIESQLQILQRRKAIECADENRPGLNGNPGEFIPEDDAIIIDIDPEQTYNSDDDLTESEFDTGHQTTMPNSNAENIPLNDLDEESHRPVFPAIEMDGTSAQNKNLEITADRFELGSDYITKTYLCQFCDMAFATQPDCASHEAGHDRLQPYSCTFCNFRNDVRQNLTTHIREMHDAERPFICVICHKGFCRRSDLKKHSIVHTGVRPYNCSICSKNFSRNSNLTKHMAIHRGGKPHVCQVCPRSFSTISELMRHSNNHVDRKPFQCTHCVSSFTRRDKLLNHVRSQHPMEMHIPHTQETVPPLTSATAFNQPNVASGLSNVQLLPNLTTAPARPTKTSHGRIFACETCGKTFTRERDLQRHQPLHLDSLFACKQCGEGFYRREKLLLHEQKHHAPHYPCHICNITFYKPQELEAHSKVHLLQHNVAMSNLAALSNVATVLPSVAGATGSTANFDFPAVMNTQTTAVSTTAMIQPNPSDMTFYSQMVPTMNLGFYSETCPEDTFNSS